MNASRLEKSLVVILMVIFAGVAVHAPLSVGLGTLFPDYGLLIKSWKEILLILAVLLTIVIVSKRKMWRELLSDRLCQLVAIYVLLHIVLSVIFYHGPIVTAAGLAIDLRYVLFLNLTYVTLKILPQHRRRLLQIGAIGACVVVGFATLQLFLPADILSHIGYGKDTIMPYLTVDKNPEFIRVNSTLRGPNPVGAYAGLSLGLLAAALVRRKLDLQNKKILSAVIVFAMCSLVALWISYSRSALVAGLITVLIVVGVSSLGSISRRTWLIVGVLVTVLAGSLVAARDSVLVSNVLLHENLAGGSSVSSNEGHAESLAYGINQLIHQPFGAGIGSTGSASLRGNTPVIIENQYLFIAHETGWAGIVIFMMIYVGVLVRLWRARAKWLSLGVFASGIGLGLIGLLLPVWVDDTISIVWWGLAAIALAGGAYARKSTK